MTAVLRTVSGPGARVGRRLAALREALGDARGSMTVLTTGVLVVVLMLIGAGTAITGVQLERNGLQYAADSAALAASQAVDPSAIYVDAERGSISPGSAREAAEDQLRDYPHQTTRTVDIRIDSVTVDPDGTAHVVLTARTHPPLLGWFTRGTGQAIPLIVEGEARAR